MGCGCSMAALWVKLIYEALLQKDKSPRKIGMFIVRTATFSMFGIFLMQQALLINATWSKTIVEYNNAVTEYEYHQCAGMRSTNRQILTECDRLSATLKTHPFVTAFTEVVYGWNTCITMPCSQLAHTIAQSLEYKILTVLVSLCLFSYIYHFFMVTREKTTNIQDFLRDKHTQQLLYQLQQQHPQHPILYQKYPR